MASNLNKTRKAANYKMFIDALATDGALCNAAAKEYDEQGTFEGGAGNRLLFTRLNDSVTAYHSILKVLTGERRANITESIPVIDYLHLDNTSMMSTYEESSPGIINPRNIKVIEDEDISAIDLINAEIPGFLNRLFKKDPGDVPAYFFNTLGQFYTEPNIQVSGYTGNHAFIYRGVHSKTITDAAGVEHVSQRLQNIFGTNIITDMTIQVDPADLPDYLKHGNNILSPESSCEGKGFVIKLTEDGKSWNINLSMDDYVVFIPAVTYSSDPSVLVIFKFDQTASDASQAEQYKGDNTYQVFVTAVTNMIPSRSLPEIPLNTALPQDFWKPYIIDTLNDYLKIEEEFYTDASSLLNGGFDIPYKLDETATNIKLWKLLGDYNIAKSKGVIINKSSKYFKGHLLGRGYFYDDPLKLTESDYNYNLDGTPRTDIERAPDGTLLPPKVVVTPDHTPTVNLDGSPERYAGKATLMYDKLITKVSELFKPVKRPDWSSNILYHPIQRLDSITKKLDYSTEQLSEASLAMITGGVSAPAYPMKYPSKFDSKNNQSDVGYKEIQAYIDLCTSAAGSGTGSRIEDGVIHFATNSSEACFKIGEVKEKTWLFGNFPGNWFQDASIVRDDGELIYEKMDKAFYIEYIRHYKKAYKWFCKGYHWMDDPCIGIKLKTCSPLEAFSKKLPDQAQQNTILVYPEYNDLLPEELYLLSRYDLGLEQYGRELEGTTVKGGMVSFYNASEEKLISFKVAHKYSFLPSKIHTIEIYDAEKELTFSKPCHVEGGTKNDCYIYTLHPMELSLKDLKFFGQDDTPISLEDGHDNINLVPLSYPSDYFLSEVITSTVAGEDNVKYVVDNKHRTVDLQFLEDSVVIPDLPEFTDENVSILDNMLIGHTNLNMHIFKKLIVDGIGGLAKNLIKRSMYQILAKWDMTTSETNPVELENMPYLGPDNPGLVAGMVSLNTTLNNMQSDQLNFPVTKTVRSVDDQGNVTTYNTEEVISIEDLQPLLKRIKFDDILPKYSFTVDGIDFDAEAAETEAALDSILTPAKVTPRPGQLSVVQPLESLIGLNMTNLKTTRHQIGQNTRPSLERLAEVLRSIFSGKSVIERSDCVKLDSYLGNGSQAIIRYGDPTEVSTPESIMDLNDKLSQLATYVIRYCDDSAKKAQEKIELDDYKAKQASLEKTIAEEIASRQEAYYTGETICKSETGDTYSISKNETTVRKIISNGDVIIPATVDGYSVVSIDNLSIKDNTSISSLSVPNTVQKIDSIAITGCTSLKKIKLSSTLAYVGAYAFANCSALELIEIYSPGSFESEEAQAAEIARITHNWDPNWKGGVPLTAKVTIVAEPPAVTSLTPATSSHEFGLNELYNLINTKTLSVLKDYYISYEDTIDYDNLNMSNSTVYNVATSLKKRYRWLIGIWWKWKKDQDFISTYEIGRRYFSESWRFVTAFHHNIIENTLEANIRDICNRSVYLATISYRRQVFYKMFQYPNTAFITMQITAAYKAIVGAEGLPSRPVPYERITEDIATEWVTAHNPCTMQFRDLDKEDYTVANGLSAFELRFDLPKYSGWYDTVLVPSGKQIIITDTETTLTDEFQKEPESYQKDWVVETETPDISLEVLNGVANFVKVNLEGIEDVGSQIRFIKNDRKLSGRQSGLYYQRYLALNNRLNKLEGTLNQALMFNKGSHIADQLEELNSSMVSSYNNIMQAIPIKKIEPLEYMPTQTASATQFAIPGKYYYSAEIKAMKEIIGDKCVLTCNSCNIKDSCPFYNEDEILKLYCTPCRSIDLWVKDNELDLLYYDESEQDFSPNLKHLENDGSSERLSHQEFKDAHLSFSDILKKSQGDEEVETYTAKDLENLRLQLASQPALGYHSNRDGLGWLLGARYGTVHKNTLKPVLERDEETKATLDIPDYTFLYDAVYFADEETEVVYRPSSHRYKVHLTKQTATGPKTYTGDTRIKIPATLKIFANAKPADDVYLVSDDTADSQGNPIDPIIYLGHVGDLKLVFDLVDDGINNPLEPGTFYQKVTSDKGIIGNRIYAQDAAQASVNIVKGNLMYSPLDDRGDFNTNKDQYWMKEMKKPYIDADGQLKWQELPGRPRIPTGYQEAIMDKDHIDEGLVLSGKMPVATYMDYVRRVSIIMYTRDISTPGSGTWDIPWVNPQFVGTDPTTIAILAEKQRKALTFMKTNLRLVVVKV